MVLPLYSPATGQKHPTTFQRTGNAGLWYNKFCNLWPLEWEKGLGESKIEWVKTVCLTVGDKTSIEDMAERQQQLIEQSGGFCVKCTTTKSFVTGMGLEHPVENGFAWHHSLGTPYLPGSGVKGAIKSWAQTWGGADEDRLASIFGNKETEGSFIFLDMIPQGQIKLHPEGMTPHYGPYHQKGDVPGDWHNPIPIPFLAVAPGGRFQFGVIPLRKTDPELLKLLEKWIGEALVEQGLGAKTSSDYGKFVVEKTEEKPLKNEVESFKQWFDELMSRPRTTSPYDQIADKLECINDIHERQEASTYVQDSSLWKSIKKAQKKKNGKGKSLRLWDIIVPK